MKQKRQLKTTGQAIDYLNVAVLGKDAEYPAVAREYEGVEPLQDRIVAIENVDRDITDRLDVIENLDRDISTQLEGKADKTQVASDLALKADKTTVNYALSLKADADALEGLATESYVDAELATKLDADNAMSALGVVSQADVVNGINNPKLVSGKVIKDYADTKVDEPALANALATKVDKTTTVNNKALSSNITLDGSDILITGSTNPFKDNTTSNAVESLKTSIAALEAKTADSGVLTITTTNERVTSQIMRYRKVGQIVHFYGEIAIGPGPYGILLQMPVGFRPLWQPFVGTVQIPAFNTLTRTWVRMGSGMNSSGEVYILESTTTVSLSFSVLYTVN